jgi:hypothetical protein
MIKKWFINIEIKFHPKNSKNKGVALPVSVIIIGGRVNVKQSITKFIDWAKGIILAGTTYGKYGQTKGPKVIP